MKNNGQISLQSIGQIITAIVALYVSWVILQTLLNTFFATVVIVLLGIAMALGLYNSTR